MGRPESSWLSHALSEMLDTELASGEHLRTVPGENVARMKAELAIPESSTLASETLARVRKIQDAARGKTVLANTESGTESDLPDLVSRCGKRLRDKLGMGGDDKALVSLAAFPKQADAAALYANGICKLREFDPAAARVILQKAVELDPTCAVARTGLARAWATLGYADETRDEARRALELAKDLPAAERISIEALYHELSGNWPKAVELYRTLFRQHPDDLEPGLRLAAALTMPGQGNDALRTVAALRRLRPPASADPRIELAEAIADQSLGRFQDELAAASRAAAKAAASGASLVVARAQFLEGIASRELGHTQQFTQALKECKRLYMSAGDRGGAARAFNALGQQAARKSDTAEEERLHEETLAICPEVGEKGVATLADIVR